MENIGQNDEHFKPEDNGTARVDPNATIPDPDNLGGSDFVTVATSKDGKRLTKRIERDGGGYKIIPFGQVTWYSFTALPVSNLVDLARVLDGLGRSSAIISGNVRDGVDASKARRLLQQQSDGTPPTLEDCAHAWLEMDFDKIPAKDVAGEYDPVADPDPERAVRQLIAALPPEFHGAGCHWRLSSSAGFKAAATINMRLFFWLDRVLTAAEKKDWLSPYLTERDGKKHKVNVERGILDGSLYSPAHLNYCAPPELEDGIDDPVERRSGLITGGIVCVPAADTEREVGTDGAKRREKVFREKEYIGRKAKPDFVPDNPKAIDDVIEYLKREAPAVEGENGDPTTVLVANRCGDLGVTGDTAHRLMLEHWNPRCVPPWQAEGPQSLRTKVESAYRSRENEIGCDAGQPPQLALATPYDTAERFVRRLYTDTEGRRRLVRYRGDFFTWTGTHYRPLSDEALRDELYQFLNGPWYAERRMRKVAGAPSRSHRIRPRSIR